LDRSVLKVKLIVTQSKESKEKLTLITNHF